MKRPGNFPRPYHLSPQRKPLSLSYRQVFLPPVFHLFLRGSALALAAMQALPVDPPFLRASEREGGTLPSSIFADFPISLDKPPRCML
jgi:hypothetical protein